MTSTNGTEGVEESLPAGFQTGLQQLMAKYNLTAGEFWASVSIMMKIFHSPGGGKSGGSDYTEPQNNASGPFIGNIKIMQQRSSEPRTLFIVLPNLEAFPPSMRAKFNMTAGEVWSSVSIIIRIFQEDREGRTTQFRWSYFINHRNISSSSE